ncbi:MAG: hypothetical protein WDM94_14320 [Bauldia sp.]
MSIDFTGHCRLSITDAQRRIDYMRREHPEWFGGVLYVSDAHLGRFDAEIARQFGIDAKSAFSLHLLNKDWLDECREAVEYTYRVFGTTDLVITYGNDSIRAPLRQYQAMPIP